MSIGGSIALDENKIARAINKGIEDVNEAWANATPTPASRRTDNLQISQAIPAKTFKAVEDNGGTRVLKQVAFVEEISAAELDEKDIPPVRWIVKGLLPTGLSLLAAPPKTYKSFMMLDLCACVCEGRPFLGRFECEKCDCLYLDLESSERRPRDRLRMILGENMAKPNNLFLITGDKNPGRLGAGLEEQLKHQLDKHPDIRLIVIDVFQKIRPEAKRTQNAYQADYADAESLKRIADTRDVCILLVSHTRKARDPNDIYNEISGSTGQFGAMDTCWMIKQDKRGEPDATFYVTGKDVEPQEYRIHFNPNKWRWAYVGTEQDVADKQLRDAYYSDPLIRAIKEILDKNHGLLEGSSSKILEDAKRLGYIITYTPTHVGRKLNEYENLLNKDGITFRLTLGKGRTYRFEQKKNNL